MAKIWFTYARDDNEDGAVDCCVQELIRCGLDVKYDRVTLDAGKRIWEQIDTHITGPDRSDAWVIYATQASMTSEACREEYEYALGRALDNRGNGYPVIALFQATIDLGVLPAGLRTRLCVSMSDTDWKERIKAAAEGREPAIRISPVVTYVLKLTPFGEGDAVRIEVRPRVGIWSPVFMGVPLAEKGATKPQIAVAPRNYDPAWFPPTVMFGAGSCESADGQYWLEYCSNSVSPSESCYMRCRTRPSRVAFGVYNGQPQYSWNF